MAEYHVGAGTFGIYAGTLKPEGKDGYTIWRNKSDVTDKATAAVVSYFKT